LTAAKIAAAASTAAPSVSHLRRSTRKRGGFFSFSDFFLRSK